MTLKNILKTTALFTLISSSSFSAFADTQKMYGIQGDSLSITTTVQAPQSYEVNGKTYTTQGNEAKSYSKEGTASYYHHKVFLQLRSFDVGEAKYLYSFHQNLN